jgi:hypothetical protein
VVANPSKFKRGARISTGGNVPHHYLAPRTSSSGNNNPFHTLIHEHQFQSDEVYPRQCPCLRAFDLGSALGTWRTRRRSDESIGTREFTQVRPPWKVKGLRPACLTLY